jgi:hypothetical protein
MCHARFLLVSNVMLRRLRINRLDSAQSGVEIKTDDYPDGQIFMFVLKIHLLKSVKNAKS